MQLFASKMNLHRPALLAALGAIVLLEGAYGCIGSDGAEEFIDENIGETSQALCGVDVSCDSTTPPPGTPADIEHTPFTVEGTFTVSWPSVSGATSYKLQRSLNGGSYATIYTGLALKRTLSTSGLAEGSYKYRIAACNSGGCSSYKTGKAMFYGPGPNRSTTSTVKTMAKTASPAPVLGMGHDELLRQNTGNTCVDTAPANVTTEPWIFQDSKIEIVSSRSEVATLLHLSQNLGVGAKYGEIDASLEYEDQKSLLHSTTRVESTWAIVVSSYHSFRSKQINNRSDLPLVQSKADLLRSDNGALFRNQCGDKFVYRVLYGRKLYMTGQIKALDRSAQEIKDQTKNLRTDLQLYANADTDVKVALKSMLTTKYMSYDVKFNVMSYGSTVPASDTVDLATAMDYLKDFGDEPVDLATSGAPIDILTSEYTLPSDIPSSKLPEYQSRKEKLQKWYKWDALIAQRCEPFDRTLHPSRGDIDDMVEDAKAFMQGRSLRDDCYHMKRTVEQNIRNCEDTTKWGQCIDYNSSSCQVVDSSNVSTNCLTFATRLPEWQPKVTTLHLYKDFDGQANALPLYPVTACSTVPANAIFDRRFKGTDCTTSGCAPELAGVTVTTSQSHRASNGFNGLGGTPLQFCAGTFLSVPCCWTSGARINQKHAAHLLEPKIVSYLF